MSILKLSNFIVGETYAEQERNGDTFSVDSKMLAEIARSIAIKNPLWLLTVAQAQSRGLDARGVYIKSINAINVLCDGVTLGIIRTDYGRSKYGLSMSNERIRQDMERSSSIFTADPKKALTIVRKYFVKPNATEKLEKATARAEQIYYGHNNKAQRALNHIDGELISRTKDFAHSQGGVQFELYLQNIADVVGLRELAKRGPAMAEMLTAEDAYQMFKGKRVSTILVSGKEYIVQTLDNVQLYDDTTLPEHLKAKLGMLKLVEEEQVVTGIGCRVSVDAFVVALDDSTQS